MATGKSAAAASISEPGPRLWRVALTVPEAAVAAAERLLEPWAEAVSVFEARPSEDRRGGPQPAKWTEDLWLAEVCVVEGIAADEPGRARLLAAAAAAGLPAPAVSRLPARDWLAWNRRAFAPFRIGRIAVHGRDDPPPRAPVRLELDAALAFGTGRHATTAGCLDRIDRLSRRRIPIRRVLDIGAGTGILAFAALRLRPGARAIACDIDPAAVAAIRANARRNGLRLAAVHADGLAHRAIRRAGPQDLVLANLLYRPLLRLAPELSAALAPGGRLVLSGILTWQAAPIRLAFRRRGLRLETALVREGWSVLVMRRA